MAFIQTKDGTNLFYKDCGTGKPVVLIPGWCINCDSWEYVMNDLPHHGLRCITYDQRRCGRSDHPWTGYDYDSLSDDLDTLLEHLDVREATLVGHSMAGGIIVRHLTRHGQQRVARAVLVSTTTPFLSQTPDNPDGFAPEAFEVIVEAMKKDRARYLTNLAPAFFGVAQPDENVSQALIDWAVSLTLLASPQASIEMLRTNFQTDQREELKNITIPTLIIHGDADQNTPLELTAKRTHELIPNSQLQIYQGQAHGLYITHAKQLNTDLLEFINRH